ncbi:unnamed protein product [Lactuca virosa]|uniref:Uncharacterized protein n=1 Tax=Lactuca virosa TaxID=75947 RepID=A0AAU9LI94_9ASTR|nr:unnamed protein product [Lactuca virosa]
MYADSDGGGLVLLRKKIGITFKEDEKGIKPSPSDPQNNIITKPSQEIAEKQKVLFEDETNKKRKMKSTNENIEKKKQKTTKDILKDLPSINSRMNPEAMLEVIRSLSLSQKKWVKKMGFGSLLELSIKRLPLKLVHFVVQHYNHQKNIKRTELCLIKKKIHKVLVYQMEDEACLTFILLTMRMKRMLYGKASLQKKP